MYDFSALLGKTVTFSVYATGILQQEFTNVRVMGIFGSDTARQYIDPATMHVSVYPSLPAGTPNNHQAYLYLQIKFPNGDMTCLGTPWIDSNTVVIDPDKVNRQFLFRNISVAQVELLRQLVIANNITNFEIIDV